MLVAVDVLLPLLPLMLLLVLLPPPPPLVPLLERARSSLTAMAVASPLLLNTSFDNLRRVFVKFRDASASVSDVVSVSRPLPVVVSIILIG